MVKTTIYTVQKTFYTVKTFYKVKTTLCMVKTTLCSPKDPITWMGMMPGMMGQLIPIARQSSTNFLKVAALKKSCVTMKSAPASTFSLGNTKGQYQKYRRVQVCFKLEEIYLRWSRSSS